MTTFILLGLCASGAFSLHRLLREGGRRIELALAALDDEPSNVTPWPYGVRRTTSLAVISRRDAA